MNNVKMKPCPFCGDIEDLQLLNQGDCVHFDCHYQCDKQEELIFGALAHTWFVNCPTCGANGPTFYVDGEFGLSSDEECKESAIEAWNKHSDAQQHH